MKGGMTGLWGSRRGKGGKGIMGTGGGWSPTWLWGLTPLACALNSSVRWCGCQSVGVVYHIAVNSCTCFGSLTLPPYTEQVPPHWRRRDISRYGHALLCIAERWTALVDHRQTNHLLIENRLLYKDSYLILYSCNSVSIRLYPFCAILLLLLKLFNARPILRARTAIWCIEMNVKTTTLKTVFGGSRTGWDFQLESRATENAVSLNLVLVLGTV